MPHTTVSHSGMLSREPGATNLPSSPMITPPMSRMINDPMLQAWLSQALEVSAIGVMVDTVSVMVVPPRCQGPTRWGRSRDSVPRLRTRQTPDLAGPHTWRTPPRPSRSGVTEPVSDLLGPARDGGRDHHEDRGDHDRGEERRPVDPWSASEQAVADQDPADAADDGEPERDVVAVSWGDELAQEPDDDPHHDDEEPTHVSLLCRAAPQPVTASVS